MYGHPYLFRVIGQQAESKKTQSVFRYIRTPLPFSVSSQQVESKKTHTFCPYQQRNSSALCTYGHHFGSSVEQKLKSLSEMYGHPYLFRVSSQQAGSKKTHTLCPYQQRNSSALCPYGHLFQLIGNK
ncbi:MAG: hypothetical protein IKN91_00310 [Paludibacteraceae bacterium]|nr:hypothetical protein [Paludibacteraceae bacterium]